MLEKVFLFYRTDCTLPLTAICYKTYFLDPSRHIIGPPRIEQTRQMFSSHHIRMRTEVAHGTACSDNNNLT